jgi:hypothetical protein
MDVAGQKSPDQRLDYQTPEIQKVEFSKHVGTDDYIKVANTDGSQEQNEKWIDVAITGKHFGTDAVQDLLWAKGVTSYHYAQFGDMMCRNVTEWTNTRIACSIPPWQGKDLKIVVNVTGVFGESQAAEFSYTKPVMTDAGMVIAGLGGRRQLATESCASAAKLCECPTEGGRDMVITGSNLGQAEPQFPGGMSARETKNVNQGFLDDKDRKPGRSRVMVGSNVVPNKWVSHFLHTQAQFKCPEDTGQGCTPANTADCVGDRLKVFVRANNQDTEQPAAAPFTFRYLPPTVNSVTPNDGPTSGGTLVTISGSSFGSDPAYTKVHLGDKNFVSASASAQASTDLLGFTVTGMCAENDPIAVGCMTKHGHTEIVIRTPGGIGKGLLVTVENGWGQSGNTAANTAFSFDPPRVTNVAAFWPDRPIKVYGDNFGAFATKVSAHIEGIPCKESQWLPGNPSSEIIEEQKPHLECLPGSVSKYQQTTRYVRGTRYETQRIFNATTNKTTEEQVYVGEDIQCFKNTAAGEQQCLRAECAACASRPASEACCCCTFEMRAEVGRQKGTGHNFTYTTPVIQTVNPNEPDATSAILTITGVNLGDFSIPKDYKDCMTAGTGKPCYGIPNVTVHVGNDECENYLDPEFGGSGDRDGWFLGGLSYNNQPILKCMTKNTRVGPKKFSVNVASLTYQFNDSLKFIAPGCKKDFYGGNGETCAECPVGGVCLGGLNEPYAKPGFWLSPLDTSTADGQRFCKSNALNRSACPFFIPCEPTESCLGGPCVPGSEERPCCGVGYAGERCATCAEDYYRINGVCQECPKCPICVFLVFFLMGIGALALGWVLQRKEINVGLTSIGIDFFQVLAIFAQTRIEWPQAILDIYEALSVFNLNIELTAPECSFNFGYETKWFLIQCIPLIGFGIFLLAHWGKYFHKRCIKNRRNKLHSHVHTMIGVCLVLMYYGYLYICKSTLDVMNCGPTTPYDGKVYMEAVFEECYKPGGMHLRLLPWAIIFFLLYAIGYPSVVAYILYNGRESAKEDQLLRANDTGMTRKTNPNCYDFRKRYHKLYYMFKPDFTWWVLVILLRKFLLSIITIIFRKNALFQMATMLLVLFGSFSLQVVYRPYMSMSERKKVLEDHARRLAEGGAKKAEILLKAQQHGSRRHKNLRLGDTKTPTLREQTRVAANYFFNYNTVEAYLLTALILVALSGVMYESDRFENDRFNGQQHALTAWVLMVIVVSIGFWLTVFCTEVALTIKPDLWQKKLKRKEEHKDENDGFEMKQGLNPLHHQSSAHGDGSEGIARANVAKAQAEAALGRHKNVIDEQSKEILDLKKKVQAQALSSSSSRRLNKKKKDNSAKKKTKKAFGQTADEDEDGGDSGKMVKMDLDDARESMDSPMASI